MSKSSAYCPDKRVKSAIAAIRVNDWWDYKLTPPLSMLWAAAIHSGRPLLSCWHQALALLVSIAVCASYVSLINDHFDREEDLRSGKVNRLAEFSRGATGVLFALCALTGLLFLLGWRDDWRLAAAYLGSWIAFTLYSAPPFRLKTRALLGVIADAAGASLFPSLLAVLLSARAMGHGADPMWLAAAAWAFGWGLRGILWHQLTDLGSDRLGRVSTFAARYGPEAALFLSRRIAFPVEIAALGVLLWGIKSLLPPLFLLFYLCLVGARKNGWGSWNSRPLLLDEYYDGLLPVALVLASAAVHPMDLWLLPPLLLIFSRRTTLPAQAAFKLLHMMIAGRFGRGIGRTRTEAAEKV